MRPKAHPTEGSRERERERPGLLAPFCWAIGLIGALNLLAGL